MRGVFVIGEGVEEEEEEEVITFVAKIRLCL